MMRTPLSIVPSAKGRGSDRSAPVQPNVEHLDDAALLALVLGNDLGDTRHLLDERGGLKALLRRGAPTLGPVPTRALSAAVEVSVGGP